MHPDISARLHLDVVLGSSEDQAGLNGRTLGECLVNNVFERKDLSAAPATISRDDQFCFGIVVALGNGLSGETAENDGVDGSNSGTRQHGHRQLGGHGHVNGDTIALLNPQLFEPICHAADFAMQLSVGQLPMVSRFAFPNEGDLVSSTRFDLGVEAVVRDVRLTFNKPTYAILGLLVDRFEWTKPVQLFLSELAPKSLGVLNGRVVKRLVGICGVDLRFRDEFGGRRKQATFLHHIVDLAGSLCGHNP